VSYTRSDDGGKSFSPSVNLSQPTLGMRRGSRLAVTNSSTCVTAIGGKQGKGRDGDVLAMCSTGDRWLNPQTLELIMPWAFTANEEWWSTAAMARTSSKRSRGGCNHISVLQPVISHDPGHHSLCPGHSVVKSGKRVALNPCYRRLTIVSARL
jgi:hypothetical protein